MACAARLDAGRKLRGLQCSGAPYMSRSIFLKLIVTFCVGYLLTSSALRKNVLPVPATSCRNKDPNVRHVMLVFGTRPEAVKMAPIIREISRSAMLKSIIVSTGQHKQMLGQVLRDFDLHDSLDYDLALMKPHQTLSELSSRAISAIEDVVSSVCPDILLVQGDTTTAYMAALVAFYSKIPVGHVEAGLRTRNIYSPFPEEVNRQSISTMATYNFAPTRHAAENLKAEGRTDNVYVTGNTVVDALMFMKNRPLSAKVTGYLADVEAKAVLKPTRMVLLTAHRRENLGKPLVQIFTAVSKLLQNHADLSIIYPIHLNPNILEAAKAFFGERHLNDITAGRAIDKRSPHHHLNRFHLVPPVDHSELLGLTGKCHFVMTDSGGIQEEAITLGKPVLILRYTTERPEGVIAGASKLVGTNADVIVSSADSLLRDERKYSEMANAQQLFGDGHAAAKIVQILEGSTDRQKLAKFGTLQRQTSGAYDLVVVVTIWKRNTIDHILKMVQSQSGLIGSRVSVILFQNGAHLNISSTLTHWSNPLSWNGSQVDVMHILNDVETGYYGRFLSPLAVSSTERAKFIILDDDIIFGRRYFENMLRVVEGGSLATRNGRFLGEGLYEFDWRNDWKEGDVDTFDDDDEYDFGGHMWAGQIAWLRTAWQHPPPIYHNAEDFWLSAVLKRELGVTTKRPRCPAPRAGDVEMCACSMKIANDHVAATVGQHEVNEVHQTRSAALQTIAKHYAYVTILSKDPTAAEKMGRAHSEIPIDLFSPSDETKDMFAQCLFWY